MNFNHPKDTKAFLVGVFASITAVVVWDIIKSRYGMFNYAKKKEKQLVNSVGNIENEIR